jgi:hypothetical protein
MHIMLTFSILSPNLSDLHWYDGGIEPPLKQHQDDQARVQVALAIRKLTPEQNIVIHTGASQVREQIPKELGDIRIRAVTLKCMVRRRTATGLKLGEGTVCVNVSGLLVENRSPGT